MSSLAVRAMTSPDTPMTSLTTGLDIDRYPEPDLG